MTRTSTAVVSTVATHCPYCALQCGMHVASRPVGDTGGRMVVSGNAKFPVNEGGLCVKGWSAAATLDHPERLTSPLVRDASGAAAADELGRCAEVRRGEARRRAAAIRARRRRRFRRRLADEREGVSAGQVRPRRTGHREHRLQRALLHVVGGRRPVHGVRDRSRAAVSARRHSRGEGHPARRQQRRRDDAADHAVLRGAADRDGGTAASSCRPAADADRRSGRRSICRSARDRTRRSPTACCTCSCATT